jgi:hypothetical protein
MDVEMLQTATMIDDGSKEAMKAYDRAYDRAMAKCKALALEALTSLGADPSTLDDFSSIGIQGYAFQHEGQLVAHYFTGNPERKGGPRIRKGLLRIRNGRALIA